ncbi:helix-turn-helix domain-containing protein [Rahnella woolbedingensis]|uniref:helix-turn-helix domain-containing protein n=1 Tax=Rahnella woolbedingensis TaxID=1510574 RepID=UPI001FC94262|nr:helix-turn-helix transcriptional regulator [Rahnella woolbedingensis]
MTPSSVEVFLSQLSENERRLFTERLSAVQRIPFEPSELTPLIIQKMKQQNITYEELALQIGISLSTFKRMIADPAGSKTLNLNALLKELGIKIWLEK